MGFCSDRSYECAYKTKLKFVAFRDNKPGPMTSICQRTIVHQFDQLELNSDRKCGHLLVAGVTCQYHLSLDSRILSVMQQTPMAWRMSSFLFLSFSVIPSIHRKALKLHPSFPIFFYDFLLTESDLKMTATTWFHAEKCCHLMSAHAGSARRICSSIRQFLIHVLFVLDCMTFSDLEQILRVIIRNDSQVSYLA